MARVHFTDLAIRALKGSEKYETFFDTTTKGFGIRCGLNSKTFLVVRGRKRERITIGRYPDISLADARTEAKRLLAAEPQAKAARRTFSQAKDEYLSGKPDNAHRYHLKLIFNKHFATLNKKQLSDITDNDVSRAIDKIEGPSAKLHAFRAVRALFRWCTRPPRRYLNHSPLEGYEAPGTDRKGTRTLTDDELKAVWNASASGNRIIFRLMILWGTRNSETVCIERDWVTDGILVIPGNKTKNGRDHAIPLQPMAKEILALRNTSPYYFPGRSDEHFTAHSLAKIFREIKEDEGLSGFTIRDIRRTFRSNMARLKVPRDICEVLINHAPPVLDEIYDRFDRLREKKAALAKYEAFMRKLLG